jgi:hypothetical protein
MPVSLVVFTETGTEMANGFSRDGNGLAALYDKYTTEVRSRKCFFCRGLSRIRTRGQVDQNFAFPGRARRNATRQEADDLVQSRMADHFENEYRGS